MHLLTNRTSYTFLNRTSTKCHFIKELLKRQSKIGKKSVYRKALGVTFITIGLIILALGIYAYAFSTETQTQTKTIDASEAYVAQLELEQGDAVHGVLTIFDGNEGIAIYVENPTNESIYDGGTVYTSLEFTFNTQTTGVYTVNFENLSFANQQTIEYSLMHSTYSRPLSIVAIIIGAILLPVGITTTFISIRKSHN